MGEHITVEDSFDYVKKATEPLQQCIEELEGEKESWGRASGKLQVERDEARAKNKRLEKLLSDIYYTFESEPYFTSTGRLQIAMWIKDIKRRINMLKEGE